MDKNPTVDGLAAPIIRHLIFRRTGRRAIRILGLPTCAGCSTEFETDALAHDHARDCPEWKKYLKEHAA
jgi:hypothetical protein